MVKGQLFGEGQRAVDMWAGASTLRSRRREVGRARNGQGCGPSTDSPSPTPLRDKTPRSLSIKDAKLAFQAITKVDRTCLT